MYTFCSFVSIFVSVSGKEVITSSPFHHKFQQSNYWQLNPPTPHTIFGEENPPRAELFVSVHGREKVPLTRFSER
jgi:hypothetical protein